MEKLYKVVCANFAITDKETLSCDKKMEDKVDDAKIALVGIGCNMFGIGQVASWLGVSHAEVEDMHMVYARRKGARFARKLKLVQNGMKL